MRNILVGLTMAASLAVVTDASAQGTAAGSNSPYLVYFDFDSAVVRAADRNTVARAAEQYRSSGSASVSLAGHTDTAGSADYNRRLAQRRAEAVRAELVRQGVPASAITTVAEGEEDLVVETGDGVREPRNRRVDIVVPTSATPPVAAAPAPAPVVSPPPPTRTAEREPVRAPTRFEFGLGAFYGFNLYDRDDDFESHLGGLEVNLSYVAHPNVLLNLQQAGFYNFRSQDDGWGGRTALGAQFGLSAWGTWRPYFGVNIGGYYGDGFEDDMFAGPELGFKINTTENTFTYLRVAYDWQWDNNWDEGVANAGLGWGWRF